MLIVVVTAISPLQCAIVRHSKTFSPVSKINSIFVLLMMAQTCASQKSAKFCCDPIATAHIKHDVMTYYINAQL